MSSHLDRRSLLKLMAGAGAGGFAATLLPATARAAALRAGHPAGTGRPGGTRLPADDAADRIAASVRRPWFPGRVFPVTRFGAAGDGTTDCTAAFRAAIRACHAAGGGHVLVPAGTFLTGAIHLLSNVDLHLEKGATIRFSQDPAAYLPVVFTRWQGIELMNYSPFIYCYGQRNVAITGQGTLDGQADASHWWNWKPLETPDFTALESMADNGTPVSQRVFGDGHYLPPPMIQPFASDRVLIEGVTVINSPFWHLNPNLCTNVTVTGVTINSAGPNTDGCDPESCDGVLIDTVNFSCGDDCIAIKSGRNTDGRRVGVPCQNVVVQNCTFASGHGGITCGSEESGGVRNVYGRDLVMSSPILQSGHRIKANSLRGGYVENTNVYRVQAGTIGGPLLKIEGSYSGETGNFPPTLTGISLAHWTVDSCQAVWAITGTSASDPVGTVSLTDLTITTMTGANSAVNVSGLRVTDVTVGGVPVTG